MKELVENRHAHGSIMKKIDFYVAPFLNPDGYVYSRHSDRMWAKNRKRFKDDECLGVNLNHNWNSRWGEERLYRENICSWKYPGPFPFSEPETRAVSEFLVRHAKNMKVFISFAAYGQTLEYPFGYTDKEPKDVNDLEEAAQSAIEAVQKIGGPKYKVSTMFKNDGYSTGNMIDWVKGSLGIKYVYNVQLRDNKQEWFIARPENILPTSIDALQIVKGIVEYVTE
uniref:Carboxypeptidase n=1 Tax=Nilaparvata lugens TaxID=108931 RepID=F8UV64_NILLU|nr:carboxypeptidase [Nilaparvata lugens]